jgi:hypothetical protein
MLAEQITVETTAKSIRQLIAEARNTAVENIPARCTGIMLRYPVGSTTIITMVDAEGGIKPGSTVGAVVLDAPTENLLGTTLMQHSISKALLKCDADTQVVNVIVTQE